MIAQRIDGVPDLRARIVRKAGEVRALADYRLRQLRHRPYLPPIDRLGERIVHDLAFDGVSVTTLDKLNIASTQAFRDDARRAVAELKRIDSSARAEREYGVGFEHCVPLNPSRIAEAYPAIYMWGLDHGVLDIVENFIGTPLAYHGVILRKELVNGEQEATRGWHLDSEDHDITRISIYLTDIEEPDDGAFEYIPRLISPSYADFSAPLITDEQMEEVIPAWQWKPCCGPAETVLFKAVSHIFHRGKVPNTERIAASFYYTSRQPTWPRLCREFSFRPGMHALNDVTFTQRQLDCLWEYKALLPHSAHTR